LYITIGVIVFVLLIGGYLLYKFSKRWNIKNKLLFF
jgi:hypothetical protein